MSELRCPRCRGYAHVATFTRVGDNLLCGRCAAPPCKPDTASGPGDCGKPATFAVDRWPDYGATWDRRVTLHVCSYHAWAHGAHYGELRCLGCGATVRDATQHNCSKEETDERNQGSAAAASAGEAGGDPHPPLAAGAVAEASGVGRVGRESV